MELHSINARRNCQSAFVYGAGAGGELLCREIRSNRSLAYRICGFLDDDVAKQGRRLQGIPVLGGEQDLERFAAKYRVSDILLAMPSITGPESPTFYARATKSG